ncbi:HlyD family efflux transporter periplasmic adaptor subunit [Pigmentiphaga litoralis]|uniref:HlyD family efflux transporter periplasmic adaptor subunit n=1 Tax=Pigmentiphaga litoralis TaxID=516702 RepID=UPI003B43AF40
MMDGITVPGASGRFAGGPSGLPGAPASAPEPLPELRQDLSLLPASDNRDGSPAWMIQDPVANRFYRIGWLEFEMLSHWQPDGDAVLAAVHAESLLRPGKDALDALLAFLRQNYLVRTDTARAADHLAAVSATRRQFGLKWLLHHYLYIRIPLVRPDRLLAGALPYVSFIYTRAFLFTLLGLGLLGLILASQQWDSFLASVQDSFTPAGVLAYMAALSFAKVLHELGHAFTATRYGVRVAHMGVSLVVMFPMLYTDTSESWKLTNPRQRLAIVSAGMMAEMGLALLATLGWSITEDGVIRSALFFLATTSWILTLGVNASPFMRFDGYFVLSDLLDLPNLHARSSAFGRAFVRRRLLGWNEPAPELLSRRLQVGLTAFALTVWVVRAVVFLGIAVAVYLYFFKALGIFLFLVEICWFIVMPIWSEMKVWARRRTEIRVSRKLIALSVLVTVMLFLAIPLPHGVRAPGWIHAEKTLAVYAPFPARVSQVRAAGPVAAGDVLLTLESPDTTARGERSDAATATLWAQLRRADATEADAAQRGLLSSRLRQEMAERVSATEEMRRLELVAPFAGTLTDLDPLVQSGAWVNPTQALGMLVDAGAWVADAFVSQDALRHLALDDRASVYVGSAFEPLRATVIGIDTTRTLVLPDDMLAATHGGPIRVGTNGKREVQHALYRVRLRLADPLPHARTALVDVVIHGQPYAIAADWLRTLGSAIIRESGF